MARSLKKGPFVASYVMEKVEAMNASGKKDTLQTWSRASTILPNILVILSLFIMVSSIFQFL
jgi:small subunit ribosomal protein S19